MKCLAVFLVSLFATISIAQNEVFVEACLEEFITYEYDSTAYAKSQLDLAYSKLTDINDNGLRAKAYKYYAFYYDDIAEPDLGLVYVDSAEFIYKTLSDSIELVNCYNYKGIIFSNISLLDSSAFWYKKGLDLANKIHDNEGIAKITNNLAIVFMDKGDYLQASNYFHESIRISKEIGDLESEGNAYNNLGTIYAQMDDYDMALSYHHKALEIRKNLDSDVQMSSVLLNIGRVYLAQEKTKECREYSRKSLAIDERLEDWPGVALNYNNIGLSFLYDGVMDSSLYYYQEALIIREELGYVEPLTMSYSNLGEFYFLQKKYSKSVSYCLKSYDLAKDAGLVYEQSIACGCLSKAYDELGATANAFRYLKEQVELEALLRNDENTKAIAKQEMEYMYYYKNLADSLERERIQKEKDYLTQLEIEKNELEKSNIQASKRTQLIFFSVLGVLLIIVLVFIISQLKKQQKKTALIKAQKELITEQKHEIDQSINYAEMIQRTSLPEKTINDIFKDSYLLYKPKDIVSGDFYWIEEDEELAYFAVADCTGHGIPGAFIALIGTILLNEIFNSKNLKQPNNILDELNRLIQLTLTSSDGKQMKDGMDLSFCMYNKTSRVLSYSGANNPLWIISKRASIVNNSNGSEQILKPNLEGNTYNLFEIKPDKQPVGKYMDDQKPFSLNQVQLEKGDSLHIFTDGYADQFGGERGKKYKYKTFKRFLLGHADNSMSTQKDIIWKEHLVWKNDLEQVDDICVMGVKF